jgi:glycine cleavage system aminomethyltransferase T
VVERVSDDDWGNEAFPYYAARSVGIGEVPVTALRVSYVGELGWELYASPEYGRRLWQVLWEAGQGEGLFAAGRAAFDTLRLEKGYRLWGVDMTEEDDPWEAGVGFAVKSAKGDFVGREGALAAKERGPRRRLRCLAFDDPAVVAMGKEPLFVKGRVVGYVTSGGFGFSVGRSIAFGWLPPDLAEGEAVDVDVFGERHGGRIVADPLWDAAGERVRG